jgi:phage terminase large subunit-like protein
VDLDRVAEAAWGDLEPYQPRETGYAPWNATAVAQRMIGQGANLVPVRQGYASLTAPFKHLLGLVAGGKLRHGGHPVLRWMAANCAAEQDAAGNIKPSKAKSTERIDGIVALVMALARYSVDPGAETSTSMYDDDDYDGDMTA